MEDDDIPLFGTFLLSVFFAFHEFREHVILRVDILSSLKQKRSSIY